MGKSARSLTESSFPILDIGLTVVVVICLSRIELSSLHKPELEARGFRHHALVPLRFPNEFNIHFIDLLEAEELVFDILFKHRSHAATGSGQGHLDVNFVSVLGKTGQLAIINEAKID